MEYVNEEFKTRILIAPQGTAAAGGGYVAPTPGSLAITVRAVVNMANAADLTLTLKSADDASGTNAVDFAEAVPIFVDGKRQSPDDKAVTITEDTGTSIVDFEIMPGQMPDGKAIGLAFGASNAANIISVEIFEDTAYIPAD